MGKPPQGFQIGQVIVSKPEFFQEIEHLFQPAGHKIAPVLWILAHKKAEGAWLVHIAVKIGRSHGQLVQISQQ
jgi:hypothetical protein